MNHRSQALCLSPTGRRILGALALCAAAAASSGCSDPEKLLKEQADLVCACDTYDCGMDVLKGPINQKLKELDKGGKVVLSDQAKAEKRRMIGCLLNLKAKEAGPAPSAKGSAPPKAPAAFTSTAGGYSIDFPFGKPKEQVKEDHKKIKWNEARSTMGSYTVSWADFADEAAAQGYVDSYIKTMQKEITSNEEISAGAHKGRELVMKMSPQATLWLRMFIAGKRVYKLGAGTKNDKAKAYKFLDSFKLTGS